MSVTVILARDHRGLGQKGDAYECPNQGVADKLIRLGYAKGLQLGTVSISFDTVPAAVEPVKPVEPIKEVKPTGKAKKEKR